MKLYLGIDLGTTVIKGLIMDEKGKILALASKHSILYTDKPLFAEQSPEGWWSSTLEILQILGTQVDLNQIVSIGLSGQMHGLVTYDEKYKPLRRAIVWLDQRSTREVEDILNQVGHSQMYRITGNPVFTGFLLPSLLWLKRQRKDLFKKIKFISSPKDYLALKLTGNLTCEPTDALATGAYNYKKQNWSKDILQNLDLDINLFPKIKLTSESYGGLKKSISQLTKIPQSTPIYGASDQAMAAVGSGLLQKGDGLISLSTGGQFLSINTPGKIDTKRRLHTLNHALKENGLYMAATLSAALSLKWFKENIIRDSGESQKFSQEAGNVPLGSNGIIFHPYLAGERTPYFNTKLRANFSGLSISHTRAEMIRAIMEGVAFSVKDAFEIFKQNDICPTKIILSGGGSKNPLWRQILADVLGRPLTTINVADHSPYGAALYAKFALEGLDKLAEFTKKIIKPVDFIFPNERAHKEYEKIFSEYKKLGDGLHRRARESGK